MVITLTLLLAVTQLLDAYTTLVILKRGGRELNPLMRALFDEFGREETLLLKGIFVTVAGYFVAKHGFEWMTGVLILFYVGVIAYNWRSMPK